ncbi:DUF4214 domain-containing protein [Oxalobacteraceae bacterium OM1]|nr:DUF4214 domain-containing protein [Oxalobacteraceae bacterium OM1]
MSSVFETESNDSFTLANAVSLGNTVTGALSSSNDRDYFKVTTTASGVLQFSVTAPQMSNWAYAVQVYDSNHKLLGATYLGYVANSTFSIGALNPGTYYVSVGNSNIYSNQSYTITPTFVAADAHNYETEGNDSRSTANAVGLDHVISGQLSGGSDIDCYSVDVAKAGLFSVDFKGPAVVNHADYLVSIYDPNGQLIDKQTTGSKLTLLEEALTPGKYVVQIERASGGNYQGSNYSFVAHADGTALPTVKAALATGATQAGTLSAAGQADWYKLDLVAGQCYAFSLAGAVSGAGTLANGSLLLMDSAGNAVERCANLPGYAAGMTTLSADPQIAFTAAYSGTYYLRVGGSGTAGTYSLHSQADNLADILPSFTGLFGEEWSPAGTPGKPLVVTYAFMSAGANGQTGFAAMNDTQKQAVRGVLAQYSSVLNVDFKEVGDAASAQICYGTSDQHNVSGGVTYTTTNPDGSLKHANVYLNNTAGSNGSVAEAANLTPGTYGFETLIHETGHALGLKHPGNYDSINGTGEGPYIAAAWDDRKFTVMSYIDNPESASWAQAPAMLDVAALQGTYGARNAAGTQTFVVPATAGYVGTVLSGAQSTVLDLSAQTSGSTISLTPGTFSSVGTNADGTAAHDNLAIPFGTCISQLYAGSGNDVIMLPPGGASVDAGGGTDTIVVGAARSTFTVTQNGNGYTLMDRMGGLGTNFLQHAEILSFNGATLNLASDTSVGKTFQAGATGGQLTGTAGDDIVTGGAAADTFVSNGGNDVFAGGAGLDTLIVSGKRAAYVSTVQSGIATLNGTANGSLIATADVERVRFDDTAIAYDIDGTAGQVYRLYQAAFNRKPDLAGLGFWMNFMDKGMSLTEVASRFEGSAEFMSLYGTNVSNGQLVTLLYENVLHREPEPAGYAFWLDILDTGKQSRDVALTSFSESPENQARVIGSIQNGIDYVVST